MNQQEKVSRNRTDHSETVTQGKDSVQQGSTLKSFSPPGSRPAIVDNRLGIIQRRQQEIMNNSPQVRQGAQVQHMIDNSPRKLAEKEKLENLFGNKRQTYLAKSLAAQELTPVLQRKQGSTALTANMKGVNVNDSTEFEMGAGGMGEKEGEQTSNNAPSKEPAKDDYRTKIENTEEYRKFIPNDSLLPRMDKWAQFHSCGDTAYFNDLSEHGHIAADNNNTYSSLSVKYQVSLQALLNLNRALIEKHGNYIPAGSRVFVFHRANVLDEFPQHLIYEFAAHHLAYKEAYTPINKEELVILSKAGYSNLSKEYVWQKGTIGFQALLIPSKKLGVNWLLLIRGTHPGSKSSDLLTVITDMDEKAVGAMQFASNKILIEKKLLSLCPGKVDIVGHSLGGAMAQHIAANFSDKVANVVTFQSPGIDQASVNKFLKIPEKERPKSVHHFMKGDQVDKSGDAKLPGLSIEHEFDIHQTLPSEILATSKLHLDGIKNGMREFSEDMKEASVLPNRLLGIPDHYPGSLSEAIDMLTANFPTSKNMEGKKEIMLKMSHKMQEMKNDLTGSLNHSSKLLTFIKEVIAAEGEAHLKHVFSASGFADKRAEAGITDEFMNRPTDDTLRKQGIKNPIGGMEIPLDHRNENSSQTPYEGDAYSSERLVGENVRSSVGRGRDKVITMGQIVKMTKAVEVFLETLNFLRETINKIIHALASFLLPGRADFDKIKLYFDKLWKQIETITLK